MNDAVGKNAPSHLCLESRNYRSSDDVYLDYIESDDKEEPCIPPEYCVILDECELFGISYSALKRAKERGQIPSAFFDGRLCMKRQDIIDYLNKPRKRGRPPKGNL